jgi:fructose-bisphosphate aldolase class II
MRNEGAALGHFNVADLDLLKAVVEAAREVRDPVLVCASGGEREYFGTRQLAAVVNSLRAEFDLPVFLNADHTHSLTKAVEAANAGFDAVGERQWHHWRGATECEKNVRKAKAHR